MNNLEIITIDGKQIVIKGIAKLYFEQGIPISITIVKCLENDLIISYSKLADEFIKSGISNQKTLNIINEAILEMIEISKEEKTRIQTEVITFVTSDYDIQRELIFDSLFDSNSSAMFYLRSQFKQLTQ